MATQAEVFAINLAALAREIAMDILPLAQILELHRLTDEDWSRIQASQHFQTMLADLIKEWNSASNVRERVKLKAATGLEMHLEQLITALTDEKVPLIQRVETAKFLARLGELEGHEIGDGSGRFSITLNIGQSPVIVKDVRVPKVIEGVLAEPVEAE